MSKLRQNQLIGSISSTIKSTIKKELKLTKFFRVSIDSTFDLSRKEQISFIFRYVAENGTICERLLALRDSSITSGIHLLHIFESVCEKLDLD